MFTVIFCKMRRKYDYTLLCNIMWYDEKRILERKRIRLQLEHFRLLSLHLYVFCPAGLSFTSNLNCETQPPASIG